MTEALPRVPEARVQTTPPAQGTAEPRLRRRPGYLGSVHVAQLVLIEAILVGVLGGLAWGVLVAGVVAGAGALVSTAVLLRYQGRWWYEWRLLAQQQRRRRRGRVASDTTNPRLTALRWLTPGLTVQDVGTDGGTAVGVACDAGGWYAVIAVDSGGLVAAGPGPGLPLDVLVRAIDDADHPGAILQVVTHSVPAPTFELDRRHLAAQSYQELQQSGAVPADCTTWLAVRLEARSRAEAGFPGGYDAEHAPALVAVLIGKVGRSLRESGIAHRTLTADELLNALVRACDLEAGKDGTPAKRPTESWTAWQSPHAAHVTFWVKDWPEIANARIMLDTLSTIPSAAMTLSLACTREGTDLAMRCLIRVTAPAGVLAKLCQSLERTAKAAAAQLFRLDGEHGPAVYATAPTGGGAK